jgi:hypothetical protein
MHAIAGEFRCVAGILAILAAILTVLLGNAIARRMRASVGLFVGHKNAPSWDAQCAFDGPLSGKRSL